MAQADFPMSPVGASGRKPKTSIYTVMMIISLVALLVGMVFLYLEIRRFGGFGTVRGRVAVMEPVPSSLGAVTVLKC